ncbi:MAG TPA: LacI family DNA-binding transcriptional regulator [Propionibacteriaceae bacterium]|nr:LacI family DNA-binding transcriptional regulator [Propionibacteriaceae bacterium]
MRLKDIADVVGVSIMTVSNAYNAPHRLSAELRERIFATAATMGYHGPGGAGRTLRSGKSNAYAVLFAEPLSYAFFDPYTVLLLAGFSEAMEQRKASITLVSVPPDDPEALNVVRTMSVEGMAGLCASHPAMQVARERGLRTVATDPVPDGDYVTIDDREAGQLMGRHLRRLGHRHVTIVAEILFADQPAPTEYSMEEFSVVLDRYTTLGYFDWWLRLRGLFDGLGDAEVRVLVAGRNTRDSGRLAGEFALDRADRPTAIIAVSDVMALGVLDVMADRALVAGRDVSVAGFDDIPDAARAGLTTVHQPIVQKGRLAAELLLDPELTPRQVSLPYELVVRTSTGPVPR